MKIDEIGGQGITPHPTELIYSKCSDDELLVGVTVGADGEPKPFLTKAKKVYFIR